MGDIVNSVLGAYNYVFDELADPRTKHLPLIASPIPVTITVIAYLKFCTNYGPRFMKDRKPFELKTPIMLYNLFQVFLSIYLFQSGIFFLLSKHSNLVCEPLVETVEIPRRTTAAIATWWYFFAKMTELLDTVFFVLRKKSKQISTLHLYHHTMVVISSWGATKYFPLGPLILVGTLNSFVHILMYTYYFLAGLGPQYQKYLWWKKHVTIVQLVQFLIVIAHNVIGLCHTCEYPKFVHYFLIFNTSLLFYMFSKFYYNSYIKVRSKKTEETSAKIKENYAKKGKRLSFGQ
nr:elongation of very long chain fatty acids protein AAEL008004 [Helicoverpa armigera]